MSLKQLVEGDCGGVNPFMQLGGQFIRDAAHKDEGFVQAQFERSMRQDEQMVNEFLGQVAGPPQSFQMETLLQEMREIEQAQMGSAQLQHAPKVIDEVAGQWSKELNNPMHVQQPPSNEMVHVQPQKQHMTHVREFFDESPGPSNSYLTRPPPYLAICPPHPSALMHGQMQSGLTDKFFEENSALERVSPYLAICPPHPSALKNGQMEASLTDKFFEEASAFEKEKDMPEVVQSEDWVNDYKASKESNEQAASDYVGKFWQRLQDEWAKLAEDTEHPWLSEYDENYDPYKEYKFAEENPMHDADNALEKGKEYLFKGDIPSAVLCFEAAVNKDPKNAEAWELLGISQAENEMDPQGIAALKRSLDLRPDNLKVLMALAVCYTNESLQAQAVKMLTNWLQAHPKYKHLVPPQPETAAEAAANMASSLIKGNKLQEIQNMFLEAVRMDPQTVDPEVQEALGVLYNLSSEYDKAVDCFRAALHANPQNAKVWNRLGASLANGSRSVEAVEAYQRALELEPGFIRVRYNVGVCCLNLKAYQQAVEHLLTALNMQANNAASRELPNGSVGKGQQQMSESIWSTLKMVISLMGRNDLQGFVSDRNLAALNDAFKD